MFIVSLEVNNGLSSQTYKLGDPTKEDVNLGPVVTVGSADKIRKQVQDAG